MNTFVVLAVGVILTWIMDRRFKELRADMARRFAENREEHARIEARIDGLRSDLTQVVLAVGARGTAAEG